MFRTNPAIQPTLCLIGHKLAGNPMQFVVARALRDSGLDWRFASFDVAPDQFEIALRGAMALGMAGIAVAEPFNTSVVDVAGEATPSVRRANWTDLIVRRDGIWVCENGLGRAVADQCFANCEAVTSAIVVGMGPRACSIATELITRQFSVSCIATDGDEISDSFSASNPEIEFYRSCHAAAGIGPSIVIHADSIHRPEASIDRISLDQITDVAGVVQLSLDMDSSAERGTARAITGVDIAVRSISIAFREWTGCDPDESLLREAIEEYFEL